MFSVFDKIVENAVGIEVHNRNTVGYKVDDTLKNVYVLVSAFESNGDVVPVKLEVKEFSDKKNTLYVAIALESIKKDEFSRQEVAKGVAQQYRPSSTISIYDLLRNVNPSDKDFYKYIPKMFFENKNREDKTRYSRRILTNEEIRSSIDETVQMLTTLGNVDETLDVSVNKTDLLNKHAAKINELAAKGKLTENSKAVKDLVNAIFDNAIITEAYSDTVDESVLTLNLLRNYLHNIDLTTASIR